MALPAFSNAFADLLGTGIPHVDEPPPSARIALNNYLSYLRSGAPSFPMSDHLAEDQRLRGPIYLAIRVLKAQAMQAELHAYELVPGATEDGRPMKEPLPWDHPICECVAFPNPHATGGELLAQQVEQLSLTGSSLNIIVRDDLRIPRELWSEPTGTYTPIPIGPYWPNGGFRFLPWIPGPFAMMPGINYAGGVAVPTNEVLAIRYSHPLLPTGEALSPTHACRLSFDTLEQIERRRASVAKRAIRPSAVGEIDPTSQMPKGTDLDALRLEIVKLLGGADKDGALALLHPGIKLKEWGTSDIDIGWLESWAQLVSVVLACYGIAKSMAFLDDDTTYAKLYAQLKQMDLLTMSPLLKLFSAAYTRQLIWPVFGRKYGIDFKPKKIANEEHDLKRVAAAQASGSITNNELRLALDWPPTKEAWGDERAFRTAGRLDEGEAPNIVEGRVGEEPAGNPVEETRPRNEQGRGSLGPIRQLLPSRNGHK